MIINKIPNYPTYNKISFKNNNVEVEPKTKIHVFKKRNGETIKEFEDKFDKYYGQRNIIVIGSATTTKQIEPALKELEKLTERLSERGYNIITGAGENGVMGAAITGTHNSVSKQGWREEYKGDSLSVLIQGGWGDEDLHRSTPITMAISGKESERIEIFNQLLSNPNSAVIIAKPGCTTLQEMTTLIAMNKYRKKGTPPKRIFLLGKETFEPTRMQYKKMHDDGTYPVNPYDKEAEGHLFEVIEPKDLVSKFPDLQDDIAQEIRSKTKEFLKLPQNTTEPQLAKEYNEFIKEAGFKKVNLYDYVRQNPESKKDRQLDGKDLLQRIKSADGPYYHHAINSGLYQIQQACNNLKMSWQDNQKN